MSEGFMNCPFCGRLITANATECKHCGANLAGVSTSNKVAAIKKIQIDDDTEDTILGDGGVFFKEAFTYMFLDKNWANKMGALILLHAIFFWLQGTLLIGIMNTNLMFVIIPIMTFLSFVNLGYYFAVIKQQTTTHSQDTIPTLNMFNNFITTIIAIIASFVFMLAIGICAMLIFSLKLPAFLTAITSIILILFGIFFLIFIQGYCWMFANKRSPLTALRFILLTRLIRESGVSRYFLATLYMFISNVLITGTISFMLFLFSHIFTALPSWCVILAYAPLGAYLTYVQGYFVGRCINANLVYEL